MTITTILTDIEGTTTDIRFVHDVLFPYAREKLPEFVRAHQNAPEVKTQLTATAHEMAQEAPQETAQPEPDLEAVIAQLIAWIDADKKITPLKALQGLIWKAGYENGDFQGHVYADAVEYLKAWHAQEITLAIFSSGSVKAQKLLFAHTNAGDLTPLFQYYFDTTTGPKKSASAYEAIAQTLEKPANSILFLSDVIAELDAAAEAGFKTCLLVRDADTAPIETHNHAIASDFRDIAL